MYTLIKIVYTVSQKAVERFFKENGTLLIGRRTFDEASEVLLVVLLIYPKVSAYSIFLKDLLEQGMIESYQFLSQYLVSLTFDTHVDISLQMQDFPLGPGESWFPAIDNPHQIYIALERYLMSPEQAAWVLERQVGWAYFGK